MADKIFTIPGLKELFYKGLGRTTNEKQRAKAAAASTWAFRAMQIRTNAAQIAKTQVTRGEKEVDKRHPARILIEKGLYDETGNIGWGRFISGIEQDYCIIGKTILLPEYNNFGRMIKLKRIKPTMAEPFYDSGKITRIIEYDLDGRSRTLYREQLLLIENLDPRPFSNKLCPVEVVYNHIETEDAATEFLNRLLRNYAVPPVFLSTEQGIGKRVIERIYDWWEKKFSGENQHKVAIGGWGMKPYPIQTDPDKMALPESRRWIMLQIATAFGVDPGLIGGIENTNRSDREVQRQSFWEDTFIPHYSLMLEDLSRLILKEWDLAFTAFYDHLPIFREDIEIISKALLPYWQGGLIKNGAIAKKLGLDEEDINLVTSGDPGQEKQVTKEMEEEAKENERRKFKNYVRKGGAIEKFQFYYLTEEEAKEATNGKV